MLPFLLGNTPPAEPEPREDKWFSSSSKVAATEINCAAWKDRLNYRPSINPTETLRNKVISASQRTERWRRTPVVHSWEYTLHIVYFTNTWLIILTAAQCFYRGLL